jgi:hypothetical protein
MASMTLVERLRFERLIGHPDIGPILSEAADALEAAEKALEALIECFIERGPFDEPLGESEQAPSINEGMAALEKIRSGR